MRLHPHPHPHPQPQSSPIKHMTHASRILHVPVTTKLYGQQIKLVTRATGRICCNLAYTHESCYSYYFQSGAVKLYCICTESMIFHDAVIKWKHFPRNWPFVWGIHRSPVNSPDQGQLCGTLMFSLICAWIYDWVNNRKAGDLRRHRAHYDVIVM